MKDLINLYHGTGTVFLEHILKDGLKYIDITRKYKVIDAMKQMSELLIKSNEEITYSTREMINGNNRHFQFENLYLTTGYTYAKDHAEKTSKGSEIITAAYELYQLCNEKIWNESKESRLKFDKEFSQLVQLFNKKNSPIVIKINRALLADEVYEDYREYYLKILNGEEDKSMLEKYSFEFPIKKSVIINQKDFEIIHH
ncbi:hypothetical protein [Staphylococcus equorum]|uniref:hypothetical protein n=1 Tax=Staphylococcus equorum TaxID=246432 RepID=UPI000852D745|nr:hypothetical protein [Staphylococcus equorum]OEK61766.1 hypothetical protein ASS98_08045 [Staphylococcus equorum]